MTRIDSSLFEDVPANAYKTIVAALLEQGDERIASFNMLEYFDAIDTFYEYRADAESLLLPFFAEKYTEQYPRLKRLMRGQGMKVGERNTKRELVANVLAQMSPVQGPYFIADLNAYNAMAYEYAAQSSDVSVQLALGPYVALTQDHVHACEASDTPGYAKAKVKLARESALAILKLGIPMLVCWAAENHKRFELRSPLAFAGPKLNELLTHNFEIPNPKQYLTQNFITAWDVANSIDPALAYQLTRKNFREWMPMSASAAMLGEDDTTTWALIPRGMPSILFTEHHRRLPVYLNQYNTPFINDVVVRAHMVHPDLITSLAVNPELEFEFPASNTTDRIMTDCMAIVAFAFTVVIANVEMGRGHHKPRWVHSDLNPAHIHHMQHLAPVILHRMRELLS